jgi:hypothetical protein
MINFVGLLRNNHLTVWWEGAVLFVLGFFLSSNLLEKNILGLKMQILNNLTLQLITNRNVVKFEQKLLLFSCKINLILVFCDKQFLAQGKNTYPHSPLPPLPS